MATTHRPTGRTAAAPSPAPPIHLDVPAAAAYLGVSQRFVRRLISERRIAYLKLGTHVRLARADLDAFLLAGRVEPLDDEVAAR